MNTAIRRSGGIIASIALLIVATGAASFPKAKPSLAFSSYLGGENGRPGAVAVDASGAVYVAGYSPLKDLSVFPSATTIGPGGASSAFVAKIRPGGAGFEYVTYLDGSNMDDVFSIAVGSDGSAYVLGSTFSHDFPTVNPIRTDGDDPAVTDSSGADCFVSKLSPDGSTLVYSTYLGAAGSGENPGAIAVGADGQVVVTGAVRGTDFPVANALDPTLDGYIDVFVAKISADGSSLVYSTYLGGVGDERGYGVAVDAAGAAYVVGITGSPDFPLANPAVEVFPILGGEAFITKIAPDGSSLVYSTYYGDRDTLDYATGVAVDADGNAYVTGYAGGGIQGLNGFSTTLAGAGDAFVAKLAPSGTSFVYATYLGGDGPDSTTGIAVDAAGHAFVTGITDSSNFPTVRAIKSNVDATHNQVSDIFVTELSVDGKQLVYSTYFGGTNDDEAYGIALTPTGDVYVIGYTYSLDVPQVSPLESYLSNGILFGIAGTGPRVTSVTASGDPFRITITGTNFAAGLSIFVGDDATPWAKSKLKGSKTIVLRGGDALAAKFPTGVDVPIRIVNPDGTSTTTIFAR